ncbi:MAG: HEAT repeat domain-containing protein, partial [Myxococcota bacterium]
MRSTGVALILALAAAAALADEAQPPPSDPKAIEKEVERIWTEYKDLKSNQDVKPQRYRRKIARDLGEFDHPRAREVLLHIAENDRDIRTQIAAMCSLAQIADESALQSILRLVQREARSVLPEYLGQVLSRIRNPRLAPWLVDKGLGHPNPAVRLSVIEALGAIRAPEAREALLGLHGKFSKRKAQDIHELYETLRALGKVGGEGVRDVLLAAAANEDWRVRLAAAEVILVHFRDGDSLETMRRLLKDEVAIVREIAAVSVGAQKVEALLPELILLLREGNLRAMLKSYEALKAVTGEDLKLAPDLWEQWWRDKKKAVKPAEGETVSVGSYYNFKIFSDRVLFIV